MLPCINKYFKKASEADHHHPQEDEDNTKKKMVNIFSPCTTTCCSISLLNLTLVPAPDPNSTTTTTTGTARSTFSKATASSIFPATNFTNHESLPCLHDASTTFSSAFPKYIDTTIADHIRASEYHNLSTHLCLDYAGFALFSDAQMNASSASSSTSPQPPFFDIAYKSASLNSQIRYGNQETALETAIRKRIMDFLHISGEEYTMVCAANRTAAFKLLAESYPFHSNPRLLTVYDHESEAVTVMEDSAMRKGAKLMSASFSWSSLRIHASKLKKMMGTRKKTERRRGLFVFPLQSRMTGARYPYLWMSLAQESGWHVVLDASALGAKDMDTLGLSLIQPDFIICSFYKVFGGNPSGFAGLFIKKSGAGVIESSTVAKSIGVVSIVPARRLSQLTDDFSGTDSDILQPNSKSIDKEDDVENDISKSISGEIVELMGEDKGLEIECRGLDHADSMGLILISSRLRYITNWLVIAMLKLRHPHSENGHSLVKLYGPRLKFDRAASLAFNVFDWKGEKVEPALVQKLADRSNISLSCGFLKNIWFSDKYEEVKEKVLEKRICEGIGGGKKKESIDMGINVVSASLGFLTSFEDAYRLWAFVAKFLDADFVEKERWRYVALNQKMVEV